MNESHSALNLQRKIDDLLTEWNIKNRTDFLVHDNTNAYYLAFSNRKYQNIGCMALFL